MKGVVTLYPIDSPGLTVHEKPVAWHQYEGNDEVFAKVDVILATPFNVMDHAFIKSLPSSIKLIVNLGIGVDHIDLKAASDQGIVVTNTPVGSEDTADIALALIISVSRRLTANEQFVRLGNWTPENMEGVTGYSVHGKTLGVLGLGSIGQAVARRAQGFNMKVLYHGPRRKPEVEAELNVDYCSDLGSLLSQADFVSLNCPLNDSTKHIIDGDRLAQMKKGAILINTGRGQLVDEGALVDALKSGHLGGAGLDVFEDEPNITPALFEFDNVTLLPHAGSGTYDCRREMFQSALNNIIAFYQDQNAIPNRVN